jgi:hypothetical protein
LPENNASTQEACDAEGGIHLLYSALFKKAALAIDYVRKRRYRVGKSPEGKATCSSAIPASRVLRVEANTSFAANDLFRSLKLVATGAK